jgi:hypothetical protein
LLQDAIHVRRNSFSVSALGCALTPSISPGAPSARRVVYSVLDALSPFAVTSVDQPLHDGRIWRLIHTAEHARKGLVGATSEAGWITWEPW